MKREIKLIILVFLLVVGPAVGLSLLAARVLGSWQIVLQKRMETDAIRLLEQITKAWVKDQHDIRYQMADAGGKPRRIADIMTAHPWIDGVFIFRPGTGWVYPRVEARDGLTTPSSTPILPSLRDPDEGFYYDLVLLKKETDEARLRGDLARVRESLKEIIRLVLDRYDDLAPLQRDLMVSWVENMGFGVPASAQAPAGMQGSGVGTEIIAEWRERMRGRHWAADTRERWARDMERMTPLLKGEAWARIQLDRRDVLACELRPDDAGTTADSTREILVIEPDRQRMIVFLETLCGKVSGNSGIRIVPCEPGNMPQPTLASLRLPTPMDSLALAAFPADARAFMANAHLQSRLYRWGGLLLLMSCMAGAWLIWREALSEIRQARERSDFAAAVSHDLRTPLASMRMLAESLFMGNVGDEAKRKKFLGAIIKESDRLSRLTDRALYFIRYGQGELRYQFTEGDLGALLKNAVDVFSVSSHAVISVEIAPDLPPVRFDGGALEQVVFNLLDNAVKYSDKEARIEVSLTLRPSSWFHMGGLRRIWRTRWTEPELVLSVRDHGMGMSAADVRRILNPYTRGRGAATRNAHGVGLGLALCHHVVKAHGGHIQIESEPGKGSTFCVVLPV